MVQISPRISLSTRDWIDKQCAQHEFRSNGHAVEKMVVFYRKGHRTIANLKSENAKLREQIRLWEDGKLQKAEEDAVLADRPGSDVT